MHQMKYLRECISHHRIWKRCLFTTWHQIVYLNALNSYGTMYSIFRFNNGNVLKTQTRFVLIDTNTNFCTQNRFHNPMFVFVYDTQSEFVPPWKAAFQTRSQTQTQTNVQPTKLYIDITNLVASDSACHNRAKHQHQSKNMKFGLLLATPTTQFDNDGLSLKDYIICGSWALSVTSFSLVGWCCKNKSCTIPLPGLWSALLFLVRHQFRNSGVE